MCKEGVAKCSDGRKGDRADAVSCIEILDFQSLLGINVQIVDKQEIKNRRMNLLAHQRLIPEGKTPGKVQPTSSRFILAINLRK